jgi:uncharacterized membrane protein YsdA (DUF1294 family)
VGVRGDDLRYDIQLSLTEAALGCEKTIKVSHQRIKNGIKQVTQNSLKITIPPGVDQGIKLRVVGEGDCGDLDEECGDLYVYVFVSLDPNFTRKGTHIYSTLTINSTQAAKGDCFPVATLNGTMGLFVPPNTRHNDVIPLEGCGVSRLDNLNERGNHYVTVHLAPDTQASSPSENFRYSKPNRSSNFKKTSRKPFQYHFLSALKYLIGTVSKSTINIVLALLKLLVFFSLWLCYGISVIVFCFLLNSPSLLWIFPVFVLPLIVCYFCASCITYFYYWRDKRAAKRGEWRVPEKILHQLELVGGWPGALLAQRKENHKISKESFQRVYCLVVIFHLCLWITLFVYKTFLTFLPFLFILDFVVLCITFNAIQNKGEVD